MMSDERQHFFISLFYSFERGQGFYSVRDTEGRGETKTGRNIDLSHLLLTVPRCVIFKTPLSTSASQQGGGA